MTKMTTKANAVNMLGGPTHLFASILLGCLVSSVMVSDTLAWGPFHAKFLSRRGSKSERSLSEGAVSDIHTKWKVYLEGTPKDKRHFLGSTKFVVHAQTSGTMSKDNVVIVSSKNGELAMELLDAEFKYPEDRAQAMGDFMPTACIRPVAPLKVVRRGATVFITGGKKDYDVSGIRIKNSISNNDKKFLIDPIQDNQFYVQVIGLDNSGETAVMTVPRANGMMTRPEVEIDYDYKHGWSAVPVSTFRYAKRATDVASLEKSKGVVVRPLWVGEKGTDLSGVELIGAEDEEDENEISDEPKTLTAQTQDRQNPKKFVIKSIIFTDSKRFSYSFNKFYRKGPRKRSFHGRVDDLSDEEAIQRKARVKFALRRIRKFTAGIGEDYNKNWEADDNETSGFEEHTHAGSHVPSKQRK